MPWNIDHIIRSNMNLETETIDRLYLELSQFTQAKTKKEIELSLVVRNMLLATPLWLPEFDPKAPKEEMIALQTLFNRMNDVIYPDAYCRKCQKIHDRRVDCGFKSSNDQAYDE